MSQELPLLRQVTEFATKNDLKLPVFNDVAIKIQSIAKGDDFEVAEVERLIQSDQALAAEVLRAANSPFFGGLAQITTVRAAIVRLGLKQVAQLVLLASERSRYTARNPQIAELMQTLWSHASACALSSRWLAHKLGHRSLEEEVFVGGLIHDVGMLFLARVLDEMQAEAKGKLELPSELLHELLLTAHTDQGHRLLEEWNLPEVYRVIVRDHHTEEIDPANTPLLIVRLANEACHRLGIGIAHDPSIVLSATAEAHQLGATEVVLAELEITLEDSVAAAV